MPETPYPTWEIAKEIADRLPGGDPRDGKDEKCESCGASFKDQQDRKGRR